MRGGVLIGNGNNTCVYNPPIECADNSPIPPNHVSRIVPEDSREPAIQEKIKAAFQNMNPSYLTHFNLATKICTAKFKQADLPNPCAVKALNGKVKLGETSLINMLTPIQESDINRKEDDKLYKGLETTNAALKDFLHALVEMNSYSVQVFHTDAHLGNVSWQGQNIVLHDWEKSIVGDENLLADINGSTPDSWALLGYKEDQGARAYLFNFSCWKIPLIGMRSFDAYHGIFPRNHKTLQLIHQIYFRFWDILSIGVSLMQIYDKAKLPVPEYTKKIIAETLDYFHRLFLVEMYGNSKVQLNDAAKKIKLDKISNGIHAIIDTAFAEENVATKSSVNAELLRLVAQHANSSPSKEVLYNMLPTVKNGGRKGTTRKTKKMRRSKHTRKHRYVSST